MAIRRGHGDEAAEPYTELLKWNLNVVLGPGLLIRHRVLGIFATAIGKIGAAFEHFTASYELCRKAGFRPEQAWTCCDWSDALIQKGSTDSRLRAQELLAEGLAISEELGMGPLTERITGWLAELQASAVYPDGLTRREVEVLRALAGGKTNQELADALFISRKTAAKHITNILAKTGTGNRTEAAHYATEHGLTAAGRLDQAGC